MKSAVKSRVELKKAFSMPVFVCCHVHFLKANTFIGNETAFLNDLDINLNDLKNMTVLTF